MTSANMLAIAAQYCGIANAATYYIEAPFAPWLCPLLAICGICLQLVALWLRKRAPLFAGLALVIAGTVPDRDLTLFIGDLLASIAIWRILKNS